MAWKMEWIRDLLERVSLAIAQIVTTPMLEIGNRKFSIGALIILLLLAVLVFLASRLISNWLKNRILSSFDRGLREAIATITSYLLATFGLLILLQSAGINLSSLTVLAGTLGIGFAFGLQNLTSNFVSGLTLLFEQPIKVGDYVEIDDLRGTVEKISIRSTIVRTPDDVFVIVPNLRFVEQNIVNWSYQAPRCRIHIPVSVAYGSDSVMVTEALMEAARLEPHVLTHPTPKVWFREFGESSLNFELLVWIDQPEDNDPICSSLNFLIERELHRRRIEIPFPQRDLHLRNIDQLAGLFQRDGWRSAEPGRDSLDGHQPISPEASLVPGHGIGGEVTAPKSAVSNLSLRELLRRVTYFEYCSDLELRQLIEYGYRQLFPANYVVCRENDPGDSFYIILTGSVGVFSERTEKYIATLHAGEFFGEMSLLLGIPRSATVRTLEDSTLFIIDRNDLQKLLASQEGLADQIAKKLTERQQALQDMGLAMEGVPTDTPLHWMRRRLQTLFGI
jgi:small-conductance mechanosensitive channel/CRP-like cAMP-binding protein